MRRIVFTALLLIVGAVVAFETGLLGAPYAPAQPIAFSHRDHVRGDQLECELCHSGGRRAAFAGIAPIERCMGCHRYVLTPHPEITKLRRAWDAGRSIEWVKVYALPRFVRFDHEAHARGAVPCDSCHGDVASMNRVARVTDLTMGWCVGCHRSRGASIDCLTCHY